MSVKVNISDLTLKQQDALDKMLTFTPENTMKRHQNFAPSEEPVSFYFSKNGKVHLPYRFACMYFKKVFNKHEFPNMYEKSEFKGKLLSRQEEPFAKAMEYLNKCNTCTIALYPGFGKTFLGCMISHKLNNITCVLVHRENVGSQWVKSFGNLAPDLKNNIWFVDNKKLKIEPKFIVCMADRTDKIPDDLKVKVGTLIIDEAHCFCSKSRVKPLLAFSPRYTIAETATPTKDNGMHKMIQSICGTHYIQKISDKPYNCYIIQTNLDIKTDQNSFTELVTNQCNSEVRNDIIVNLVLNNKHKKIIIVSPRVGHCDVIHKRIEENGIKAGKLYGKVKDYETSNVLIGTTSKMGVGFDEANFCKDYDGKASDLLIVTQTFKSWPSFEQVRGRGMRADHPSVVYLNDKHSITRRHMSIMRRYVKETKGTLHEIKIKETNQIIEIK